MRARLAVAIATATACAPATITWGVDDCAMFAAGPIRDVLGYDPAAAWRDHYDDEAGAEHLVGRNGLTAILRGVARRHDWRRISPAAALAGDVGIYLAFERASIAICRAPGWFIARTQDGFAAIAASKIRLAWSLF